MASYVIGGLVTSCTLDGETVGKIIVDGETVYTMSQTFSFSSSTPTGVAKKYLSTSSSTLSGESTLSAEFGQTVYGFVRLSNGYYLNTDLYPGAGSYGFYRIGSKTVPASSTQFTAPSPSGTISFSATRITSSARKEISIEGETYVYTWRITNPNSFEVIAVCSGATNQPINIPANSTGSVTYSTSLGKSYTESVYLTYSGGRSNAYSKSQSAPS